MKIWINVFSKENPLPEKKIGILLPAMDPAIGAPPMIIAFQPRDKEHERKVQEELTRFVESLGASFNLYESMMRLLKIR